MKKQYYLLLFFLPFWGYTQPTRLPQAGTLGIRLSVDTTRHLMRVLDLRKDVYGNGQKLQPGDLIVGIDGKSMENVPSGEVRNQLRGLAGTQVTLAIDRFGVVDTFALIRDLYELGPHVDWISFQDPTMQSPQLCNLINALLAGKPIDYHMFTGYPFGLEPNLMYSKVSSPEVLLTYFESHQIPGISEYLSAHVLVFQSTDSLAADSAYAYAQSSLTACEFDSISMKSIPVACKGGRAQTFIPLHAENAPEAIQMTLITLKLFPAIRDERFRYIVEITME